MSRAVWIAIFSVAVVACAARDPLSRVVVSRQGAIVRTIADPTTLDAFDRAWRSRTEVILTRAPSWQYRLTVEYWDGSGVWLYDPAGYACLLTVKNVPTYRVPDNASFNALLGVPN